MLISGVTSSLPPPFSICLSLSLSPSSFHHYPLFLCLPVCLCIVNFVILSPPSPSPAISSSLHPHLPYSPSLPHPLPISLTLSYYLCLPMFEVPMCFFYTKSPYHLSVFLHLTSLLPILSVWCLPLGFCPPPPPPSPHLPLSSSLSISLYLNLFLFSF